MRWNPYFQVREFSITDVQPYSIRLVWQDESGQEGDMEVFPKNHQVRLRFVLFEEEFMLNIFVKMNAVKSMMILVLNFFYIC